MAFLFALLTLFSSTGSAKWLSFLPFWHCAAEQEVQNWCSPVPFSHFAAEQEESAVEKEVQKWPSLLPFWHCAAEKEVQKWRSFLPFWHCSAQQACRKCESGHPFCPFDIDQQRKKYKKWRSFLPLWHCSHLRSNYQGKNTKKTFLFIGKVFLYSKGISKFSSKVGKWNHFFPMDLDILAKSQVQNYNIRSELDIFGQILKFKTIT